MDDIIIIKPGVRRTIFKYVIAFVIFTVGIINPTETLPVLAPLAVFLISISSGVEINLDRSIVREYYTLLWFKKGKWYNYNKFTVITIKKSKKGAIRYSGRTNIPLHLSDFYYEVFLSSNDFRKRIKLLLTKNKRKAIEKAKKYSYDLNLPLVKYNPRRQLKKEKAPINDNQDLNYKK